MLFFSANVLNEIYVEVFSHDNNITLNNNHCIEKFKYKIHNQKIVSLAKSRYKESSFITT